MGRLYYRRDAERWGFTTVGELIRALQKAEVPADYELYPTASGNLAICEPGRHGDQETRWYVGYLDLATGEVQYRPGARPDDGQPIPGAATENPFREPVGVVYVSLPIGVLDAAAEVNG